MATPLTIDGSQGEGGGQIMRTSVTLSAITGRPIRVENIRRRRPKPGLAAQHVTAVQAVAAVCDAEFAGASVGSTVLDFTPRSPPQAGRYSFDVAGARVGGSAGATSLVLQTLVVPLALAAGHSTVVLRGGTHVPWSPPFDYIQDVWLPALREIGVEADVTASMTGWYPAGKGEVLATIRGLGPGWHTFLRPIDRRERGSLQRVFGRAAVANLHVNIAERMAARARERLAGLGVGVAIDTAVLRAACAGAGIFLSAQYENGRCGFSALGRRGKPAETVAEEAATELLDHHGSGAALDLHLADQLLIPLALAAGESSFTVEHSTGHLETNAWVLGQFGLADFTFMASADRPLTVSVRPRRRPQ